MTDVTWLPEPTPAALRAALASVAPRLAGFPLALPDVTTARTDPVWRSATAALGTGYMVKFAWSRPAALGVAREAGVLTALDGTVPFLPEVVAASESPVLLVTRRVPGQSLFDVAGSVDRDHAGEQIARFLAALHRPVTRERAESVVGRLDGARLPPATTGRLRQRLSGREPSAERVMAWHLRTALGDALWRSEASIPLPDHRTPPEWVDDLAARFAALGITPLSRRRMAGRAPPGSKARTARHRSGRRR